MVVHVLSKSYTRWVGVDVNVWLQLKATNYQYCFKLLLKKDFGDEYTLFFRCFEDANKKYFFYIITYLYIYIFKDNKLLTSRVICRIQGFFTFFCLLLEGFGAKFGKPKNLRILLLIVTLNVRILKKHYWKEDVFKLRNYGCHSSEVILKVF